MSLVIRSFQARDQISARQLIQAGLGEHFGCIDPSRNQDLTDIQASYVARGHTFVVAEIEGELVGTGALVTESPEAARIVRMSVTKAHRRQGIGRAIVAYLVLEAGRKGFRLIRVETNHGWVDAISLYRHCGFVEYDRDEISVHLQRTS